MITTTELCIHVHVEFSNGHTEWKEYIVMDMVYILH